MRKVMCKKVLVVLSGFLVMTSCTMTKKRYSKGFYIESNKKYAVKQEKVTDKKNKAKLLEGLTKQKEDEVRGFQKTDNHMVASLNDNVVISKKKVFKSYKKKEIPQKKNLARIVVKENNKSVKSEFAKIKNQKLNLEDDLTLSDGYSLMSFVFALIMFVTPFFIIPTVVFYILGESSRLKSIRVLTFVLVLVVFVLVLLAFLYVGVWPYWLLFIL